VLLAEQKKTLGERNPQEMQHALKGEIAGERRNRCPVGETNLLLVRKRRGEKKPEPK
jgi:hypothetical protein